MNQAIHYYNQKMLKRHFLSLSEINSVINHYFFPKVQQNFSKIKISKFSVDATASNKNQDFSEHYDQQ